MFYHMKIKTYIGNNQYFFNMEDLEYYISNITIPFLKLLDISINGLIIPSAHIEQIFFFQSSETIINTIKQTLKDESEQNCDLPEVNNEYIKKHEHMITNKYVSDITNNIISQAKDKIPQDQHKRLRPNSDFILS